MRKEISLGNLNGKGILKTQKQMEEQYEMGTVRLRFEGVEEINSNQLVVERHGVFNTILSF